ncbi:type II toxin-antitoxin system YafQ family toxin [Mobiluncus porci]|uniref:Type II toxin-antitoxin system YafQ family toxin n=1 Tax=Mobiluncus porci TaxID=2652278 RepID=A0A7K0K4J5_9ACTO|nr:type II toxin-antitoxin system YafQ family toxin [Mobiluncus porci]MST50364.1 type II toxin-antitoxin system YafQ family toxin [Mobiluncus porci]
MLKADYTSNFKKDVKRLKRKRVDTAPLRQVISLVLEDNLEAADELKRRHNMHTLGGRWRGSFECHVANAGDWLVVWKTGNGMAVFQRTGTHDAIFRR